MTTQPPRSHDELHHTDEHRRYPPGTTLFAGGFAADTEVLTTDGPVSVTALTADHEAYALAPNTRLVKPKRVHGVYETDTEAVVTIETRRAHLQVAPDQRVPFVTKAIDTIRTVRAGKLGERELYKFVNDWRFPTKARFTTADMTAFAESYEVGVKPNCHGHTFRAALPDGCEPIRYNTPCGYYFDPETYETHREAIDAVAAEVTIHDGPNHWRRPIRIDGDDFLELLAWFITEGSTTRPPESDTIEIGFAQKTPAYRNRLRALFDRIGIKVADTNNGFSFSSPVYGRVLERLCGTGSAAKRLPAFVFDLPRSQQRHFMDVLIAGDGNNRGTFYTSSERLARDVLRLFVHLGHKPRYTRRGKMWQLYRWETNDGFASRRHVHTEHFPQTMYRMAVADYPFVLAGCDGKFQWVGVSYVV